MTEDPLDHLAAALKAATPDPNAAHKRETMRRAAEHFARHQETGKRLRLTPNRQISAGLMLGVRRMFNMMQTRFILTGTTALAAVGLIALIPALQSAPPSTGPISHLSRPSQDVIRRALTEERTIVRDPVPLEVPEVMPAPTPAPTMLSESGANMPALAAVPPRAERSLALSEDMAVLPLPNTEHFANADAAPLKITTEEPVSTFSIDVDTASYAVMRSSLLQGVLPHPDQVRIEEWVNYFPYDYPAPGPDDGPFAPTISVIQTPWNPDTQLLHIGLQGTQPALADRPPLNLVFLIDTSGSMNQPNKLPLLQQSLRLMLGQLSDQDEVSIVTYAGSAGLVLPPTNATDTGKIMAAFSNLAAGGSTAGQAGLQQAYATADTMAAEGEITRVILATDGDFNVGLSDPAALETFIANKRASGTYLSVLGFGRGNLDDATMQALAQNGNGTAAYIDTLSEAQKVLVDQLTGALFPIANDVKIQVEFNPATVAEYRLIGYETRLLERQDFNNDKVDAGEIGAGHAVTALYEITPVGSPAVLNDPLRYATAGEERPIGRDELAFMRLRYKTPGSETSQLIERAIPTGTGPTSTEVGFAAAIAGFGQLLRNSASLQDWSIADAISLAGAHLGADPFGYRREAVQLMRLAESLRQQP